MLCASCTAMLMKHMPSHTACWTLPTARHELSCIVQIAVHDAIPTDNTGATSHQQRKPREEWHDNSKVPKA